MGQRQDHNIGEKRQSSAIGAGETTGSGGYVNLRRKRRIQAAKTQAAEAAEAMVSLKENLQKGGHSESINLLNSISEVIEKENKKHPDESVEKSVLTKITTIISTMYLNIKKEYTSENVTITLPTDQEKINAINAIIGGATKAAASEIDAALTQSKAGKVSFSEGFKSFLQSVRELFSTKSFKSAKTKFEEAKNEMKANRSPVLTALEDKLPKNEQNTTPTPK